MFSSGTKAERAVRADETAADPLVGAPVRPEATSDSNTLTTFLSAEGRVPSREAIIVDRGRDIESISFETLSHRAAAVAKRLAEHGVQSGDRVVVMVPVSIALYETMLAVLSLGAVAVFVSPWIGPSHLDRAIAHVDPKAYVGSFAAQLLRLRIPTLRRVPLAFTTGRRFWMLPAPRSIRITGSSGDSLERTPISSEDPALISFTSGSSGVPKGANRTHAILKGQHEALSAAFPQRDDDVDATMFPVTVLNNLAAGVTSVVPRILFRGRSRFDVERTLQVLRSHGVTTCALPPPALDEIAARMRQHPDERPTLRRIVCGGAPVFNAQIPGWVEAFPDTEIVIAYGSTEAEPVAHVEARERLRAESDVRPGSPGICVGMATAGVRIRVIRIEPGPVELGGRDVSDLEVAPGAVGEIIVAGPHVCRGYFRNPDAERSTKIVDHAGEVWHRMGDTGYLDGSGRVWLVGRVHSTIRRAGADVHPQLLEAAARDAGPAVRRAGAVGLPDPDLGERVVLVLETDAGDEIVHTVRCRLDDAGFQVDEILRTASPLPLDPRHRAKIDYDALRKTARRMVGESAKG